MFFDYSRFAQDFYTEQDWNEPPLSAYNYAAIRILEGRPYDEHWRAVLSTIDVVSLYKLALTSEALFTVVMAHVRAVQPPSGNVNEQLLGGVLDRLSALPIELFGFILPNLTLADRLSLSLTSRKFAALFARELQAGISRILLRFGLSHAEIRFMQSATMSVISGQCIPYLLDYTSRPQHLDFYTPDVTYQSVLRFFALSTGYETFPAIFNDLGVPEGHDDRANFAACSTSADFIRVSRSITNSALDSVTYSPFSHLFGAVTHYGAWFAYPETSMKGGPWIIVRITRPSDASCRIQFLYDEQLKQLKHMVDEDHDASGAFVKSDWFSPIFAGSTYPAKDGCFYVTITGNVGAGVTFGRGDIIELDVNFRFTQSHRENEQFKRYIMAVEDVWCLPSDDVAPHETGYVCLLSLMGSYLSPSPTMVTAYLQDYVQAQARSLAFVKFPDNLVATRDRGSGGGSSFSFKDVTTSAAIPSVEPGIIWPTQTKRGSEKRFQCNVFGEVRSAKAVEAKGCVSAELGCPTNATCAVVELWEDQLRALNDITEGDVADAGGVCTGSWFTYQPNGDEEYRVKDTFWVNFAANTTHHYAEVGHMYTDLVGMLKPGRMVDTLVWFQRLDIMFPEDDLVKLNYYLTARRVMSLDKGSIAKRGADYVCDKADGGCQNCVRASEDR
ncbi:hypothetical protein C8F04DRAFT_1278525 [Mycena alexandri]|uniref:F-box domain-containing protein n=1 Tax=Mycena alexandri TaxID=1745969 RepID=A0AAD6WMC2_9AGAR|nr:hypothetical protein C8F04DRAFT_1278525 [Mycena alexandri]